MADASSALTVAFWYLRKVQLLESHCNVTSFSVCSESGPTALTDTEQSLKWVPMQLLTPHVHRY